MNDSVSPARRQTDASTQPQRPHEKPGLDQGDIFHILQVERRRDVLHFMELTEQQTVSIGELAEQLTAWENDKTIAEITSAERQRVYVALYQSHLPKLAEEGLIEYNSDRGLVERGEHAGAVEYYLHGPVGAPRELDGVAEGEGAESGDSTDRDTTELASGSGLLSRFFR